MLVVCRFPMMIGPAPHCQRVKQLEASWHLAETLDWAWLDPRECPVTEHVAASSRETVCVAIPAHF
jgi:hypothetical protein